MITLGRNESFLRRLNERVIVLRDEQTVDSDGNIIIETKEIANVWSEVKIVSNRVWLDFEKKENSVYFEVLIRFLSDIKIGDFVKFKSKKMIIRSLFHDIASKKTTKIICEDVQ